MGGNDSMGTKMKRCTNPMWPIWVAYYCQVRSKCKSGWVELDNQMKWAPQEYSQNKLSKLIKNI